MFLQKSHKGAEATTLEAGLLLFWDLLLFLIFSKDWMSSTHNTMAETVYSNLANMHINHLETK